ncbi:ClpP/crotonase [Vararia minispora EC-137]|uniref:ClpP/crotonase n=1 Tax=Vararia minispora EC-137 TaxID=1314806 RepID=A0ACB8QL09_9AGAM|nr:ClpP/crotonase [Vararia minispora EC-137]
MPLLRKTNPRLFSIALAFLLTAKYGYYSVSRELSAHHFDPSASDFVWQLEIHNPPDNRLTRAVIAFGLSPALDQVEREWRNIRTSVQAARQRGIEQNENIGSGALIIVGMRGQDKFFSNGFDYPSVVADPTWFTDLFDPFLMRLLTFPMPTIAAINGHCFAAGFMLSLACDYRIMTDGSKRNAWMCMNEIDFGANWPSSFICLARAKVPQHVVLRKIALEGHRFTPREALDAGLLDAIVTGGTEIVLEHSIALAKEKAVKARSGAWGLIKSGLYRDVAETAKRGLSPWNTVIDEIAAKQRLAKL